MRKTLGRADVEHARGWAIRNVEAFTPGIYRYIYDGAVNSGGTVEYMDIAVFGLGVDSTYRYVPIDSGVSLPWAPKEWVGHLSDAGVHREEGGYLGRNFMVPVKHFTH